MRAHTKCLYHHIFFGLVGKSNYWEDVLMKIQEMCNCLQNVVCGVMCKAAEGARKQKVVASIVIKGK